MEIVPPHHKCNQNKSQDLHGASWAQVKKIKIQNNLVALHKLILCFFEKIDRFSKKLLRSLDSGIKRIAFSNIIFSYACSLK